MYYNQWDYPYFVPNYQTSQYYYPVAPTTNDSYLEPYRYNESIFSYVQYDEEFERPTRDVDRVMKILRRQYPNIYREAQRDGMDGKLTEYLFRSMVRFVDGHYDNFTGSINERVERAAHQLKRRNPWIFEVMSLYNVSPVSRVRITNTVLTVAFESLRRTP
ncbi:hypothetical protein FZC66_10625 [Priestia megaterium]|nr:hypothetical protein FZC66_10625 [Priestia megaterium]